MKAEPTSDSVRRRALWNAVGTTLLVMVVSAVTVLGAISLSLYGQTPSDQLVVRLPEKTAEEFIPTAAIATSLSVTNIPPTSEVGTVEPPEEASPTPREASPVETATHTSGIDVTPTLLGTTEVVLSATPWPCAGGAPMHWMLYVVQKGDTLFSLARRHGTTMGEVIFYNCLTSQLVWSGQRLYLPPLPTPAPSTTATLTSTPIPTPIPTDAPPPPTSPPSPTVALTLTVTPSPSPSATASGTARPTLVPTATPTPTLTLVVTPTVMATSTPTTEVTNTPIIRPTVAQTLTPIPSQTPSPSPTPTAAPTFSPSPSPTSDEILSP